VDRLWVLWAFICVSMILANTDQSDGEWDWHEFHSDTLQRLEEDGYSLPLTHAKEVAAVVTSALKLWHLLGSTVDAAHKTFPITTCRLHPLLSECSYLQAPWRCPDSSFRRIQSSSHGYRTAHQKRTWDFGKIWQGSLTGECQWHQFASWTLDRVSGLKFSGVKYP